MYQYLVDIHLYTQAWARLVSTLGFFFDMRDAKERGNGQKRLLRGGVLL